MSDVSDVDITKYIIDNFDSDNIKFNSGTEKLDDITVEWYDIFLIKENLIISYLENTTPSDGSDYIDTYYLEIRKLDTKVLSHIESSTKLELVEINSKHFFEIQSLIFNHNKQQRDDLNIKFEESLDVLNSLIRKNKIKNVLKD